MVRFRPTFARMREIPLTDLVAVREAVAGEAYGRQGVLVPAAALTLTSGKRLKVSMNLNNGTEAFQRLLDAAKSNGY